MRLEYRDTRFSYILEHFFRFDYGSKFWKIKIKSFTCHCDSAVCRYDKKTNSEDEATEAEDVYQESE